MLRGWVRGVVPGVVVAVAAGGVLAAPAAAEDPGLVLRSAELTVTVGADFPRVLSYRDNASGAEIGGRSAPIGVIAVDGVPRRVSLAGDPVLDGSAARYRLAFADLPGVELDASLSLVGRVTTFRIDAVRDTEADRVNTIDIPDHDLLSVSSADPGARTAFTTLDPDSTRTADRFAEVTDRTPVDPAPVGATYAFVSANGLAAGIETNATVDKPSGASADDGTRFLHQARADGDHVRVGVWSGQWTYRGDTSPYTEPLPWAKVVVTPDANGDGTVDWQDGALAFRDIMVTPKGGEKTADRVVPRIPFNFASQATHPFLRTLDDTKRIALATDNLGQLALLKGYQAEGHDSAHPDYGGNYNTRAGGRADLNTLLAEGEKWNADFGVHVNATESYGEANSFSEELVDPKARGWNWLNQSYYIKQRPDLASGNIIDRFRQLRDETHPNLEALYIDVYYSSGWLADSLSRQLAEQGWELTTEWSDRFERSSLWSHWANDVDYGGATNKGLNSQIIRFLRNDQKDVWNDHPILGKAQLVDWEGWTGETDWNEFEANIWQHNLPAKFLQQQHIVDWNTDEVVFAGGVRGSVEDGRRTVTVDGRTVLDGDRYLLPWASQGKERPDKLYHYNAAGGASAWTVPGELGKARKFTVYKLTDTGRVKVGVVQARDGRIALDAEPGQAYVLYPDRAPRQAAADWGHGTGLADPGFNAGSLKHWGPTGAVRVDELATGQHVAAFGAGPGSIAQRITGLTPGTTYSASVWLEIEPGRSRPTTLEVPGAASVTVERTSARNWVAADDKHGSYFQRVRVVFAAKRDHARLVVRVGDGDARVQVDDARVVPMSVSSVHDFEHVDQGWWPFIKGDAGGSTDPRTHIARKHAPYTQAGWNGKLVDDVLDGEWSLKAHEENRGLVYRTAPWTVELRDGHRYKVAFDYVSGRAGQYQWVHGTDRVVDGKPVPVDLSAVPIGEQRGTTRFERDIVAGCGGDNWVGLRKLTGGGDQADFVMDNFTVTDLGPADTGAVCGKLSVTGAGLTGMASGEANPVSTTFTNNGTEDATAVSLALRAPEGWTVVPRTPAEFAAVAPGATVATDWDVTPPAGLAAGPYPVTAVAAYTAGGRPVAVPEVAATATVLPPGTIPQSRMRVHEVSSAETSAENSGAAKAIDGNPSSIWHTAYSVSPIPAYPHTITLDLGAQYDVTGYGYLPRQVGTNGRIKDYRLFVSADGQTWGEPVSAGTFAAGTAETRLTFPAVTGRYVRLVGVTSYNGQPFAAAAELTVFGRKRS
ncbi:endo-alpha-N-acetylgalactosaminidase family protein [Actinokineospora sp. UTMC 2448]|uniref:endo-alpha-N-acetylgalactosaminidase family protein n=1 Tax=Actinokineospora sp. UTMC 2448 TaxID=2268449 RepID=UPI0021642F88|nr:endo-alpha-N-acetylgalactosaminidase family protein [Actinokineospora sp. UTMC 2448]